MDVGVVGADRVDRFYATDDSVEVELGVPDADFVEGEAKRCADVARERHLDSVEVVDSGAAGIQDVGSEGNESLVGP